MKTQRISISPSVSFAQIPHYLDALKNLNTAERVVIDCSKTQAVHSAFIGYLIELKRKTSANNGELVIVLSESVLKMFSLIGLEKYFAAEIGRASDFAA